MKRIIAVALASMLLLTVGTGSVAAAPGDGVDTSTDEVEDDLFFHDRTDHALAWSQGKRDTDGQNKAFDFVASE